MFLHQSLCMKCKKSEATVRITKIIKGEVREVRLCQECAGKLSPFQKPIGLSKVLADLLQANKQEKLVSTSGKVCPNCGISLEDYRSSLFVGCRECYTVFEDELKRDLRKFHGSTVHVGKTPAKYAELAQKTASIEDLRKKMEESIKNEDFEEAAQLRDKLRELKTKLDLQE